MTIARHDSRFRDSRPDEAERGRVLAFRRPGAAPKPSGARRHPLAPPLPDLAKYERSAEKDDYRQRMMVNTAGLIISMLLIVAGIWLATKISELRRDTDCVLSGQRNCDALIINNSLSR
jgi:hypothetical protein